MSKQNRPAAQHSVVLGTVLAVVMLSGLIGCAADPIRPWYVPPTNYQSLSCDALRAEYDRVGRYLHRGVDVPRSVFSSTSFGLGAGFGGGWGGNGWGWSPRRNTRVSAFRPARPATASSIAARM